MTEAEAEKCWCPYVRPIAVPGGAWTPMLRKTVYEGQRITNIEDHCIGSACMAWRWDTWRGNADADTVPEQHKHGHCGLAGKP